MLPTASRLTRSQDFGLVVRRGRRAGRSRLVLHVMQPDACPGGDLERPASADVHTAPTREQGTPTRVGFVVSKAVGNAVMRHRVSRRLRHLMRERIAWLPTGTLVVVRALPASAGSTSEQLGADLDAAFRKLRVPTSQGHTSTDRQ